jgi:hypothetical protein
MLKKFLWLVVAVVFLCSPLWANDDNPWSEYIFAAADQKQQPASITSIGKPGLASPLDLCPNTNVCLSAPILPCGVQPFGLLPGVKVYAFQDPAAACPSPGCPTYPFEVKAVHILLCNAGPATCIAVLKPSICSAKYPTPNCPEPDVQLCTGPEVQVVIFPNQCIEYVLPIDDTCCVDTSYFACVEVLTTDCNDLEVCTDDHCTPCCNYVQFPGVPPPPPMDACLNGLTLGDFALWTDGVLSCQNNCPGEVPADTGKNHYKTWRITPIPFTATRQVKDQFMTDILQLQQLEFLSNPVRKVVFNDQGNDTSHIADFDDHLTWYRAFGRDTLLKVTYRNQFENTSVCIDSVRYLLLPAQKDGHLPPDSLDHYKAYRIQNPQPVNFPVELEDQFDRLMGQVENVTSLLPVYFLTPCQKEAEPTYDMTTHYVAYVIPPMNFNGQPRQITDQFLFQRTVDVFNSQFLLVPTQKLNVELCQAPPQETCCYPFVGGPPCGPVPVGTCVTSGGVIVPACLGDGNGNGIDDACDPVTPPDTLRNHFKTWRIFTPQPADTFALVRDQFTIHDFLFVDSIDFLSNPVRKIVFGPTKNDTSDILRPDDHLTWYRVKSSNNRRINVQVTYVNQFESTKVFIDTVKYFLLPTQKLFPAHNPPDTLLGHYTAYRIHKPKVIKPPVELLDQFDVLFGTPERLDSLKPVYFFTPADKDNELRPKSDTHYVAYEIFPRTFLPALTTQTIDQWGQHFLQVRNSEYLLVPSRKDTFVVCTHKPNDCNGNGTIELADIICDVNVVFKPATNPKPVPNCRCDSNGDGQCNLTDIIHKVNYVFRFGPEPVVSKTCCIPVK